MNSGRWMSPRVGKGIAVALVLVLSITLIALAEEGGSRAGATKGKIEASIFSFDGTDFVRTHTTLMTEAGKSAVNTKLDHDSPAYKALTETHSYTGEVTVFGKKYDGDYAPLTDEAGKVTGALFVGVGK